MPSTSLLHVCPQCGVSSSAPPSEEPRTCGACGTDYSPRRPLREGVLYTAVYLGETSCSARVVYPEPSSGDVRSEPLNPRLDLWNHSPDGFGFGYAGSGPAQLALAILAHYLGPGREALAVRLHQDLKRSKIAPVNHDDTLILDSDQLAAWLRSDPSAAQALREWREEFPFDVLTFPP